MFSLWFLLLCPCGVHCSWEDFNPFGSAFWSFLWGPQEHYLDQRDYIGNTDKTKIIRVALELIKDANMKIRQVADIKETHSGFKAFDIGLIMGNIREKYRRMLDTYREMRDKDNGRSLFVPNSIWVLRPLHYIVAMEHVHVLETEIDKLSHMLEENVDNELNPDMRYTVTRKSKRAREDEIKALRNVAREQQLKSSNREQGLQRRLGVTGHTARPRFQQRWPVDASWVLGAYGDLDVYAH